MVIFHGKDWASVKTKRPLLSVTVPDVLLLILIVAPTNELPTLSATVPVIVFCEEHVTAINTKRGSK